MSYRIEITEPCENRLRKLNKELQKHFTNKIRKLGENPTVYGKPLRGVLHGYWELYFEKKFRILYTIDIEKKIVTIEALKHKDEF